MHKLTSTAIREGAQVDRSTRLAPQVDRDYRFAIRAPLLSDSYISPPATITSPHF